MKHFQFWFWLLYFCAGALCSADEFGVLQKTFAGERTNTTFTFRNGVLIHEATEFIDPDTKKREGWMELFYSDGKPVFTRALFRSSYSESYNGGVSVTQGNRGNHAYPDRLSVGREVFNIGNDGFYHVVADRESLNRESSGIETGRSTESLEQERRKYLESDK